MAQRAAPSTAEARREQMFPKLGDAEITRICRFGDTRQFRDGELVFETGKPAPGIYVMLAGRVAVSRRNGFGQTERFVEHGPGEFMGELAQLSGRPALVDIKALGEVEALLVTSENLRALMVGEAGLGERIMRALILRRVHLIETGTGGPILVGASTAPDMMRLQGFLTRAGQPYTMLDPETDAEAAQLVERIAPAETEFPLAICPDGSILRNPSEDALARCLGLLDTHDETRCYDLAVIGAGPAGLASAVYAASEGLSVLVVDCRAFGGQAGASARIENYLGFPTGISGLALMARAFTQAQKFGAEFVIPLKVGRLDCERRDGRPLTLEMADGWTVGAQGVVIATGARYRRPDIPGLAQFEGRGVWYWASPIEARICAGAEVVLVGGGNSAGQAAVFLAEHAAKVWMLVRGPSLADSMSRYLIDRIENAGNIELVTTSEVVELCGAPETGLDGVRWRNRRTGEETARPVRNLFLFVGADPETDWLEGCGIALDARGFVVTGSTASAAALETNVPGVFAVGDVRAGSVKRVGGAIGEGAAVVAQMHGFLQRRKAAG